MTEVLNTCTGAQNEESKLMKTNVHDLSKKKKKKKKPKQKHVVFVAMVIIK